MSELHALGASTGKNFHLLESVDPKFVKEGLLKAQKKTWQVLYEIRAQITESMTEDDARKIALNTFKEFGVSKHWHRPYIRFGAGTMLTFNDPLQADYCLKQGDPMYLDLGPVWPDSELGLEYEGDVGDTFVLGTNPEAERCASVARSLFAETQEKWRQSSITGQEIYEFLRRRAFEQGYPLVDNVEGHRVSDFPHHKYSKERLGRLDFSPGESLWILEVQIKHPSLKLGAFFEDLL